MRCGRKRGRAWPQNDTQSQLLASSRAIRVPLRSADGAEVSQGLATFYADVGRVADEGLTASVLNDRAYVDAGKRMLLLLGQLTDLDAASRTLAASAHLELLPLVPAAP